MHVYCFYAKKSIVVSIFGVLNMQVSNIWVFLTIWQALEGSERSGRLVGKVSFYFHRNPTSWCRVMIEKTKSVTIKKATTISL